MNTSLRTSRIVAASLGLGLVVLASAPPVAGAKAPPERVIRASGRAVVKTAPDRARIAVSVTTRAATARGASEANARTSGAVLDKLRSVVAAPGEVKTADYDLGAEYDYDQNGASTRGPRLAGYVATHRFTIVTADLAGVGAVIDAAVAAGANQVDSIAFFLDDEDAARRRALLDAGRSARAEAGTIAESLGVTLGDLLDASSSAGAVPMPVYGREKAMMAAPAVATDVVPGSLDIDASVTVTFAIR